MQTIKTIDSFFYKKLGENIRSLREHKGMTQKELAKELGISRPLLVNYEYGYTKIKHKYWQRICNALEISPDFDVDVNVRR